MRTVTSNTVVIIQTNTRPALLRTRKVSYQESVSSASRHTIVSLRFPKEHNDFLSFLLLCNVVEKSGDDNNDVVDEDDERVEDEDEVGLRGELGVDSDAGRGQFSSASSVWTMARDEQCLASLVVGLGVGGSLRGRWMEMALRRQLSHCCLWNTSLTCRV